MKHDCGAAARFPRLTFLFVGILVLPALTLVVLGLLLIAQDRTIAAQRAIERREAAADRAARAFAPQFADLERRLLSGDTPEGVVRLAASGSGIEAYPASQALWLPESIPLAEAEANTFREAEALEYRGGAEKSLAVYEAGSRSASAGVKAGALIRLARVHRSAGRIDAALAAYRQLSRINGISFEKTPADLLAHKAICELLEESGRRPELTREAASLRDDLLAGRWRLDRAAWTLAAEQAGRWTGQPLKPAEENLLVSEAAEWLWQEFKQAGPAGPARRGSRTFALGTAGVTLLWHLAEGRASAAVILPALLRKWADGAAAAANDAASDLALIDEEGRVLFGRNAGTGPGVARRNPQETGLPWILTMSMDPQTGNTGETGMRRGLLMLGLAAIVFFLAAGIILLWWTVRRELAVAQLQADFVSAVSHEFRTPLTTMRHVTELLDEDDQMLRERRKSFYAALGRNTGRLQRLVESLLDFARMERGKRTYDLRRLDAGEFASKVVAEFRKEVEPRGFEVELETGPDELLVMADRDALGHALWNLLDNAVKYSGDSRRVQVAVASRQECVAILVRDHGLGIPAGEQKAIFGKFVRGAEALRLGIQGTGLGLAMAGHIVAAHRGSIKMKSTAGQGSEFIILLPREG